MTSPEDSPPMHLLITGATGLVGSHVAEVALQRGIRIRLLARKPADLEWLKALGAEVVPGDLTDSISLEKACRGITHIVHSAALVGDWGPLKDYIRVNVGGLRSLLRAIDPATMQRLVYISSMGVYPMGDHHQTDETAPMAEVGVDSYTTSKIRCEEFLQSYLTTEKFPAVILRPGFIYGPRDRTVLPRIVDRLKVGKFAYLGPKENKVNNTYVGNLVDAIFISLTHRQAVGQIFNIADPRLVSKQEFIEAICREAQLPVPTRSVSYKTAKRLASVLETVHKMLCLRRAPMLSQAKVKFLGNNLDYSIKKARSVIGYDPQIDFQEGIARSFAGSPVRQSH